MKVYLIGAGPGDPGLLTLKGRDILARADVIVYDALASDALLDHARPDAERCYVGKIASNHALSQDKINQLLVDKAKEGNIVARLKGGDPYIFGRGAEEAEALLAAGIPFEQVPGISSTIAGPAYAGIPLTHRAFASSVTIITGHEDPAKPGSVHNWSALAQSASTLVFVMGMKNLPEISKSLIDAGLAPSTPAALVHWGTTPRHKSLAATLGTLPQEALRQNFTNPSIIIVGHVVTLREKLNWFERKPLLGKGIVITRARKQASGMAAQLAELGADVLQFPTISIRALDDYARVDAAIAQLSSYQWLVFTSVNGVAHFWHRLNAQGHDTRALAHCRIAAIGPATAQALQDRGIIPNSIPKAYIAEGVIAELLACGMTGQNVLIPRAREAREVLPDELAKAGAIVHVLPVYETMPDHGNKNLVLERLHQGRIHAITFASSSTVHNFLDCIPAETLRQYPNVRLAAIGPITAETLKKHGLPCHIQPDTFTIPALVDKLLEEDL